MKIIKYECRPDQLKSTVYDVLIFNNEENWSILQKTYSLHYDPAFRDYNKYVFFPVQREKWNGSPDAPQNLRTLVASADVLLRAIPASTDKDLFIAGFFENPSDFESVKKDLLEFVTECYNISSKNYYTYLGEQIRLGNSSLMSILDKSQRSVAEKYVADIISGDISFKYAGEEIDKMLSPEQQVMMSDTIVQCIGGSSSAIHKDVNMTLKDFDFTSDSYAPKFQLHIYERPSRDKGVIGKYDVFLKHNGVLDKDKMEFTTKHAKALYIYFLIHASEKFVKDDINVDELTEIYYRIYGVRDEISKRLSKIDRNTKNERLFDVFIKDTKPSVNRTVLAALKGVYDHKKMKSDENKKKPFRDAEKWYTIQVDDDKQYFVSLPKDCVEVPESLLLNS